MRDRLLLIDDAAHSPGTGIADLLLSGAAYPCERLCWDSFVPEEQAWFGTKLIVIVTLSNLRAMTRFLESVDKRPVPSPIMAVLPEELDREQLLAVLRTVDDFLFLPVRRAEFEGRLARLLRRPEGSQRAEDWSLRREAAFANLIGNAPCFVQALEQLPDVATSQAPVLLRGESGTGKELFAQAIHHLSGRNQHPFVPVDCGAVPENLVENELFGHSRGAYTGAHSAHRGLVAMAEGGTLFLDEVDALSLAAQAKLLRFIQEGTYRVLGSDKFVRANVRLIAATNHDLEEAVRVRSFRLDLYYRLAVLNMRLPPLRERAGDVEPLARHFVATLCAARGYPLRTLSPATIRMLVSYHWPGNVRELFSVIQRTMVFSRGPQILPQDLSLGNEVREPEAIGGKFRVARSIVLRSFEQKYVEAMLEKHRGNITHAAAEAGKERRAFGRMIKKYGLRRENYGT